VRLARVHGRVRALHTALRNVCSTLDAAEFTAIARSLQPPGGRAVSWSGPSSKTPSHPIVPGKGGATPSAAAPSPASNGNPVTVATSRAILFVLLALAVALLAGAALPGPAVAGGAVAQHRAALTSAGISLMVAAALVLFLT
jgi:hypothetical protein